MFGCVDHDSAEYGRTSPRWATAPPPSRPTTRSWSAGRARPPRRPGPVGPPRPESRCRSHHFGGSLHWLGIGDDPSCPGEPERNGWLVPLGGDLREHRGPAVRGRCPTATYNIQGLIERHGHRTPKGGLSRLDHLGGGVMVVQAVQGTGRASVPKHPLCDRRLCRPSKWKLDRLRPKRRGVRPSAPACRGPAP